MTNLRLGEQGLVMTLDAYTLLMSQMPSLLQIGWTFFGAENWVKFHVLSKPRNRGLCVDFKCLRDRVDYDAENCFANLGTWGNCFAILFGITCSFIGSSMRPGINQWTPVVGLFVLLALWMYFTSRARRGDLLNLATVLGYSVLGTVLSLAYYVLSFA
jgi:hypothetical protein